MNSFIFSRNLGGLRGPVALAYHFASFRHPSLLYTPAKRSPPACPSETPHRSDLWAYGASDSRGSTPEHPKSPDAQNAFCANIHITPRIPSPRLLQRGGFAARFSGGNEHRVRWPRREADFRRLQTTYKPARSRRHDVTTADRNKLKRNATSYQPGANWKGNAQGPPLKKLTKDAYATRHEARDRSTRQSPRSGTRSASAARRGTR